MTGKTDDSVEVVDGAGASTRIDLQDLLFAQYGAMVLLRKLGFDPHDIFFAHGVRMADTPVLFYGIALCTQNREFVVTSYPVSAVTHDVYSKRVVCSVEMVTENWLRYCAVANRRDNPEFEERLRKFCIENISPCLTVLKLRGFVIPALTVFPEKALN